MYLPDRKQEVDGATLAYKPFISALLSRMLLNGATMEQSWNAHDTYADKYSAENGEAHGQTSLIMGQHFLERCTSAPLPSSGERDKTLTGDMLVGNVSWLPANMLWVLASFEIELSRHYFSHRIY